MVWQILKSGKKKAEEFGQAVEDGLLARKGSAYIFLFRNPDIEALVTGTAPATMKSPEVLSVLKKAVEMIENPAATPSKDAQLSDEEFIKIYGAAAKKTGFILKPAK